MGSQSHSALKVLASRQSRGGERKNKKKKEKRKKKRRKKEGKNERRVSETLSSEAKESIAFVLPWTFRKRPAKFPEPAGRNPGKRTRAQHPNTWLLIPSIE
jgi:hypothetical protein